MLNIRKVLAFFLILAFTMGLLAGCSTVQQAAETQPVQQEQTQQAAAPQEEQQPEMQEISETEIQERQIIDMAGRTVTLPAEIRSVFSTGPVSAIYLYTLVPDLLLGWNYELNAVEKSIILEKYHELPNFGMGDGVNYEAVIAANPSLALNVGKINDAMISACDELSESLGIPVVAVDSDLRKAPEVYRFMGTVFGVEERAEELAAYAQTTFREIADMNISEEEKVRIYYGNGQDSLETAPAGSSHGQLIDLVNAVNAADLELGDGSRVRISAEQLLAWDPDVIVVNGEPKADITGGSAAASILENPDYATLKAVQNGKVYGTPNAPFSWVDRPPGPNRIVGIRWLAGRIYPDRLNYDVDEEVCEFFRLFYHVELSEDQLQALYSGTLIQR